MGAPPPAARPLPRPPRRSAAPASPPTPACPGIGVGCTSVPSALSPPPTSPLLRWGRAHLATPRSPAGTWAPGLSVLSSPGQRSARHPGSPSTLPVPTPGALGVQSRGRQHPCSPCSRQRQCSDLSESGPRPASSGPPGRPPSLPSGPWGVVVRRAALPYRSPRPGWGAAACGTPSPRGPGPFPGASPAPSVHPCAPAGLGDPQSPWLLLPASCLPKAAGVPPTPSASLWEAGARPTPSGPGQ